MTGDDRYSRQTILPEVGAAGQEALKKAHVVVVGMGGLGSAAAPYLASAGVGELTLVDGDRVSLHNLQRQNIYEEADVQRYKVLAAADYLRDRNSHLTIHTHGEMMNETNAEAWLAGADVILDGTDCIQTRHLLNRMAIEKQIPLVFGAASGWRAQAGMFAPWRKRNGHPTACLACYLPEQMEDAGCAAVGVMGAVVGMAGVLQAGLVLRYLLSAGEEQAGKLWIYDMLKGEARTVWVERDVACGQCGHSP